MTKYIAITSNKLLLERSYIPEINNNNMLVI